MGVTGDPQLDAMYAELDELDAKRQEVLAQARDLSTRETRSRLGSIDGRKQAVWTRIRQRKAERSAGVRGEQVPRPPSETGLRRARWEK